MNKLIASVGVATALAAGSAQATTLSGDLTTDNAFFVYLSTSPSALGTLLTSGSDWTTTYAFTSGTLSNQNYYLNIEAINQGGPSGFIGTFTLNGTNFEFANGGTTISTDTTNWIGSYNNGNSALTSQSWVTPTGGVVSYGANGVGPWGTRPDISLTADWIWPSDSNGCGSCTVDLQTEITYIGPSATPLPSTWTMLIAGFAGFGFLAYRGTKKSIVLATA